MQKNIARIVAFGDSLQDKGELCRLLPLSKKACHDGFFSNGQTAVYHLRDLLEVKYDQKIPLENFAIAAALTSFDNPNPPLRNKAFPVTEQIDRFESSHGRFQADDLVVITGGGNNFFFSIAPEPPYIHPTFVYKVASDLDRIIDKICRLGAKNIIISNVPDVTLTPLFNHTKKVPKWFIKWLKRFYCHRIKKENSKLEKKVEHLKSKYYQVFIYLFDSQRFMRRLVEKPFEFGFESSSEACIFSIGGFDLKGNIQTDEEIILKEDPETHLFWDLVHPTTKAHKVVAKEWLKFFS